MGYSGAGGKLIHEKHQKQKISWHCPFKQFCYLKTDEKIIYGPIFYPTFVINFFRPYILFNFCGMWTVF